MMERLVLNFSIDLVSIIMESLRKFILETSSNNIYVVEFIQKAIAYHAKKSKGHVGAYQSYDIEYSNLPFQ